jgi:hypothetical protein
MPLDQFATCFSIRSGAVGASLDTVTRRPAHAAADYFFVQGRGEGRAGDVIGGRWQAGGWSTVDGCRKRSVERNDRVWAAVSTRVLWWLLNDESRRRHRSGGGCAGGGFSSPARRQLVCRVHRNDDSQWTAAGEPVLSYCLPLWIEKVRGRRRRAATAPIAIGNPDQVFALRWRSPPTNRHARWVAGPRARRQANNAASASY